MCYFYSLNFLFSSYYNRLLSAYLNIYLPIDIWQELIRYACRCSAAPVMLTSKLIYGRLLSICLITSYAMKMFILKGSIFKSVYLSSSFLIILLISIYESPLSPLIFSTCYKRKSIDAFKVRAFFNSIRWDLERLLSDLL